MKRGFTKEGIWRILRVGKFVGEHCKNREGEAFTHIHCCWSDDDNNAHAGHMFQSVVHVVAEIHIRIMAKAVMTRCPSRF